MKELENYPGNKGNSGVWQTIINHIPPHRVFIEGCLGSGKIIRKKRPAEFNIGIEKSRKVFRVWKKHEADFPNIIVVHGDILEYLTSMIIGTSFFLNNWLYSRAIGPQDVVAYFDPPYPKECRGSKDDIYEHEWTDQQHVEFLTGIKKTKFHVLISTYPNSIYTKHLHSRGKAIKGWNFVDFKTRTRTRTVTERLYFNFPIPTELHDYRFVGNNYRDRERIKNKITRRALSLVKLKRKNPVEYHAVIDAINRIEHGQKNV